jgi:hypothetical protein
VFKLAKDVMSWLLPPCAAMLVACNPPPKEAAMQNPNPGPETAALEALETGAQSPASAPQADSPEEAQGRRTLSTAFVRIGPDGHLTVELRNGRTMVLRDVAMLPRKYCGVAVLGASAGTRYCGGYGEIAAARPGGAPTPGAVDPATVDPGRVPPHRG